MAQTLQIIPLYLFPYADDYFAVMIVYSLPTFARAGQLVLEGAVNNAGRGDDYRM
jgi:hypothetical protein